MTISLRIVLFIIAVGTSLNVHSQDREPVIEDFAFLTGFWQGTGFGGISEEIWMPPSQGSMFGIFKQSSAAGLTFTEFLEITKLGDEFVLRLKHFNPDFSGWEEKSDYVTFKLQSVAPNKAVFSGLSYEVKNGTDLRIELRLRESDGSVNTAVFELHKSDI